MSVGPATTAALTSGLRVAQRSILGPAVTYVDDDAEFANLINGRTHQQDAVVSVLGWQYAGYWDDQERLTLARRRLPGLAWERAVFANLTLSHPDSHNTVNLGVSLGDGRLHVAFDHHSSPLNYFASVGDVLTDPSSVAWSPASFENPTAVLDPADGALGLVTYPRFVNRPDGGMLFAYREFSSGNGRLRLVDYLAGIWSNNRVFIERTGLHDDAYAGESTSRNPYLNRLDYDALGTLHTTWCWREKSDDVVLNRNGEPETIVQRYNRDIAYAYSTDDGVTWRNGATEVIADTNVGESIVESSPGVNAIELGSEWGLLNNQAQTVDGRGRVHTVMYRKETPTPGVISYAPNSNRRFVHHWRDFDGTWHSRLLDVNGNRPKMVSDTHGNLLLVTRVNGSNDLRVDFATPEADYQDWRRVFAWNQNIGSEVAIDFALWRSAGVLSILTQGRPARWGQPSPVVVYDLVPTLPMLADPDVVLAPEVDTYVTAGVNADTNYEGESRLVVKSSDDPDFHRHAFLRFDLTGLPDATTIRSVELVVGSTGQSARAKTTPYGARRVSDDGWNASTLTWNSAPAAEPELLWAQYAREVLRWDVTDSVLGEMAGDGVLSLRLEGLVAGPQRALNTASSEHGDANRRPRLELRTNP